MEYNDYYAILLAETEQKKIGKKTWYEKRLVSAAVTVALFIGLIAVLLF